MPHDDHIAKSCFCIASCPSDSKIVALWHSARIPADISIARAACTALIFRWRILILLRRALGLSLLAWPYRGIATTCSGLKQHQYEPKDVQFSSTTYLNLENLSGLVALLVQSLLAI